MWLHDLEWSMQAFLQRKKLVEKIEEKMIYFYDEGNRNVFWIEKWIFFGNVFVAED